MPFALLLTISNVLSKGFVINPIDSPPNYVIFNALFRSERRWCQYKYLLWLLEATVLEMWYFSVAIQGAAEQFRRNPRRWSMVWFLSFFLKQSIEWLLCFVWLSNWMIALFRLWSLMVYDANDDDCAGLGEDKTVMINLRQESKKPISLENLFEVVADDLQSMNDTLLSVST